MSKKTDPEPLVRETHRKTRRKFSSEEKIRIVLQGLRGEETIAEPCRREQISPNLYYNWSKEFLEAGKQRLQGNAKRAATSTKVVGLRKETAQFTDLVADLSLRNSVLKRSCDLPRISDEQ